MNGASLFGRTLSNFVADYYGRFNGSVPSISALLESRFPNAMRLRAVIIPMTTIAGLLMFAMFGATTVGGMLAFAILYGFFSGCCTSPASLPPPPSLSLIYTTHAHTNAHPLCT